MQNHLNLFRLYFATTYAERQLYGEEISLSGRREDLPGRQLYGEETSLSGRRENLPERQLYGKETSLSERRENLCRRDSFTGKGLAFLGEWNGAGK